MKSSPQTWAWGFCGLLLLATMLNYMDRQALAVTLPLLKTEYHLTESRVGMLEGCFGFAFAFGSILFGWLADRWGPRYLYPLVLTGWSAAGMATALAGQPWLTDMLESTAVTPGTGVYYWLLICRILLGICEAGHWPCALLTIRAILAARDRTLGNGILQSGASLGAIAVPIYIELAERNGQSWEFAFWSIGLMGLLWVPIWFGFLHFSGLLKNDSATAATLAIQERVAVDASHLFWRKAVVLGIIVGTLVISWQFLRAWLGLYLQDYRGFSAQSTRFLMSGYFIAADVGCLLAGFYVTWLTARGWSVGWARKTGYLLFTLLTACGAVVPFVNNDIGVIVLLFITAAGILGLHPFYYALAQEISARRMGIVSGTLAAFGWIVSSISQIQLGAHIEDTQSYRLGLVIVGCIPVLGLLALWLIWPSEAEVPDANRL